jgi:hypothetical protein
MEANELLTRSRLLAMRFGAHSQEERTAAARLLAGGIYRESTKEELATCDNPYFLAGEFDWKSPETQAFLDSVPAEVNEPDEPELPLPELIEVVQKQYEQAFKERPEAEPEPVENDLASKMRNIERERFRQSMEDSKPASKWQLAPPSKSSSDQHPLSPQDPIY